jgi:DNA segregation ATPase FtsK/SpoIIIE, S-DNA-T family
MANSKLLKEAIADAKAVRETAIANAKIALEEAFTPRLQSILSKKLQAEMEGEEEEPMDEMDSSDLGVGDNVDPSAEASDAHTELGPESEEETAEVGEEDENLDAVSEEYDSEEMEEEVDGVGFDDPTNADDAEISEEEMEDEDELDLESIIRELEMGMEDEEEVSEEEMDSEEEMHEEEGMEDEVSDEEEAAIDTALDSHEEEMHGEEAEEEMDDEIDLEEILREMGYGDDEEEMNEEEEEDSKIAELEAELEEAYSTVKSLQSTINEVNLLNAKLLYANRLFRAYNLNNEQKSKVVENLDRTTSVREVKLVYATLAESMNFTGTEKKTKKVVAEAASKPVASTAPAKEIISESTNELARRFKELANIK